VKVAPVGVAWAEAQRVAPPLSAGFVASFAESRWGRDDHLTSLVRYMAAADALRPKRIGERGADRGRATPVGRPRGRRFVLSPYARVVRDLHDCPAMLHRLASAGPDALGQDALPTGTRHSLLLLDGERSKSVRNFNLDEATADLLEFAAEPRSHVECSARYRRGANACAGFRRLFQELVRTGALCEIPATSARPARRSKPQVPP
jgi:hypothetical protein